LKCNKSGQSRLLFADRGVLSLSELAAREVAASIPFELVTML